MRALFTKGCVILAIAISSFAAIDAQTGKNPVIVIPGITGSTLVNERTGKTVWFSFKRDKTDDLRLPMTSPVLTRDRDGLRPTDIIRKVDLKILPDVEIYQVLLDALEKKGYTEATWNHPKATDVYYVFAYDWRRDIVENAQLLMQHIAAVKRTLRRPRLKFDILAHSMGGLVARYAAMYGSADLPREGRTPVPTWAGAASMNKLMMFGTPNEGSFSALEGLLDGYPIVADRKLPFIDDLRAEDVMTCPAVYELLPHRGSARFLDENLKPMQVDLYNPENWIKYNWGAITDPKFLGKLRDAAQIAKVNPAVKPTSLANRRSADDRIVSETTYFQVRTFLSSVLSRARRFERAIDAPEKNIPIRLYAFGGNCQPTTDAVVLIKNKDGVWDTVFDPKDLKTADGREIKKDDVRAAIQGPGDGRVTERSLLTVDQKPASTEVVAISDPASPALFTLTSSFFGCGTHTKLFLEKPIQDSFLSALVVTKQGQP